MPRKTNNKILKEHLILCEGRDEQEFLIQFLESDTLSFLPGFSNDIQVMDFGGNSELLKHLTILKKMDVENYDLSHLGRLKMINSAHELVPLNGVLKFIDFLANNDHEVELLVIKGHRHAMDYAMDYIDESLDFLYQTIKEKKNDQH